MLFADSLQTSFFNDVCTCVFVPHISLYEFTVMVCACVCVCSREYVCILCVCLCVQ